MARRVLRVFRYTLICFTPDALCCRAAAFILRATPCFFTLFALIHIRAVAKRMISPRYIRRAVMRYAAAAAATLALIIHAALISCRAAAICRDAAMPFDAAFSFSPPRRCRQRLRDMRRATRCYALYAMPCALSACRQIAIAERDDAMAYATLRYAQLPRMLIV